MNKKKCGMSVLHQKA